MKDKVKEPGGDNWPKPPVKEQNPDSASTVKKNEPRGIKAWLIRFVNRAVKKLSKFN